MLPDSKRLGVAAYVTYSLIYLFLKNIRFSDHYFFFPLFLLVWLIVNFLFFPIVRSSHKQKRTCAVESISAESSHTGTHKATVCIRAAGELTAVPVVHSTFVYV